MVAQRLDALRLAPVPTGRLLLDFDHLRTLTEIADAVAVLPSHRHLCSTSAGAAYSAAHAASATVGLFVRPALGRAVAPHQGP